MSLQLNLAVFTLVLAGVATAAETAHVHGAAEIELAVEGSDVAVNFASPMYNLVGFEHAPRDAGDREAVAGARALLDDPSNVVRLQADAACTVVELDVHWDMPTGGDEEHAHDEAAGHDAHHEHDAHDADDAHREHEHDAHDADDAHHGDEHDAHDAHHDDEHDVHDADAHHDDHDAHHEHEHDAHDADDAHHDAGHDHDAHEPGDQHTDVTLAIRYRCDHPDRLTALDVTAFESFERLSEVELRAVGPGGAVAETASPGSPQVDLRNLLAR